MYIIPQKKTRFRPGHTGEVPGFPTRPLTGQYRRLNSIRTGVRSLSFAKPG